MLKKILVLICSSLPGHVAYNTST